MKFLPSLGPQDGAPSLVCKPLLWCSHQREGNAQASTHPVPPAHSLADVTDEVQILLVNVHSKSLPFCELSCFSLLCSAFNKLFLSVCCISSMVSNEEGDLEERKIAYDLEVLMFSLRRRGW